MALTVEGGAGSRPPAPSPSFKRRLRLVGVCSDINKLAELIRNSTMPAWLHEYLDAHRDRLKAELQLFGQCEIPMPDGGKMIVRAEGWGKK